MKTGVKIVLVVTGVLGIAGLVYWVSRKKYKAPSGQPVHSGQPGSPQLQVSSAPVSSAFPLKNGSNNSYVKQLQTALGVTADGAFGANTLAALQSQYGISTVPSQSDLNSIVNGGMSTVQQNISLATSLTAQFAAGGVCITVYPDTFCTQVNEDGAGDLNPTGLGITLSNGKYYDMTDYVLDGATMLGKVILKVSATDGTAGEYTLDPNNINLVVPPSVTYNPIPTVDPSTGLTTL